MNDLFGRAAVQSKDKLKLLTIRPTAFDKAADGAKQVRITVPQHPHDPPRCAVP